MELLVYWIVIFGVGAINKSQATGFMLGSFFGIAWSWYFGRRSRRRRTISNGSELKETYRDVTLIQK